MEVDRKRFPISHLQFMDDMMIFCEVVVKQVGFLRCVLHCFETMSGLKINLSKCEIF